MTTEPMTPPPAPRRRRWPTVLLAVSLTLNLLVLGVIAGAHFRDDRDARMSPPPDRGMLRESGFAPFFDAMPRDARRQLAESLRAGGVGFGPDRAALAAEFRLLLSTLRADPFEPTALDTVLAAQYARVAERVTAGRAALVNQVAAMSPAERTAFADELERRFTDALTRFPGPRGPDGPRSGD